MLAIRFQRRGRKNDPSFRIIVSEKARSPKAGNPLEVLGSYDPITKEAIINGERVKHWVNNGAELSGTVNNLLISKGIIEGKKVNVLRKKSIPKKEEEAKPEALAPQPHASDVADNAAADGTKEETKEEPKAEASPEPESTEPKSETEAEKPA